MSESSIAKQRERAHFQGRELMARGYHFQALQTLNSALVDMGPHVGLLSDISATLYLLGRIEESQIVTRSLEKEINLAREKISNASLAKTFIFLGKVYEEQGDVACALNYFARAVNLSAAHFEIRLRGQSQLLRLQSFLGKKKALANSYLQLCKTDIADDFSLLVEIEHGLILSELQLFDSNIALQRMRRLMKEAKLTKCDLRLILFDVLEELALRGSDLGEFLVAIDRDLLVDLDPFEHSIWSLLKQGPDQLEISPELLKKVPLLNLLRILVLQLVVEPNQGKRSKLKSQFYFFMEGVASLSKSILLRKWRQLIELDQRTYHLEIAGAVLRFEGKEIRLKPESFGLRCLEIFSRRPTVGLNEFCTEIYGATFNASYFDRVRMAIGRLNSQLRNLTGHQSIFRVSSEAVELDSSVKIQSGINC